jgi:hypothetical protein
VSAPFETRLLDLLPPVYREADAQGDLAAFLALPGAALDDLKALADRFPELFDVDRCEARYRNRSRPCGSCFMSWLCGPR